MQKILVNTTEDDLEERSIIRIHRSSDGSFSIHCNDIDVAVILTWD